jgi:hypothetical protein
MLAYIRELPCLRCSAAVALSKKPNGEPYGPAKIAAISTMPNTINSAADQGSRWLGFRRQLSNGKPAYRNLSKRLLAASRLNGIPDR